MTKSTRFLVAGLLALTVILYTIRIAHAETHISDTILDSGAIWTASNSPYIIDGTVTIPPDQSLTIMPGVSVVGSAEIDGYSIIDNRGSFFVRGDTDHRVSVSGYGTISSVNAVASIENSDISLYGGLSLYGGETTIASSTIASSTYGIYANGSDVKISASRLIGNEYGIYVKKVAPPVYMVKGTDPLFGTGGIGNAMDTSDSVVPTSTVDVSGSSIVNSSDAAVYNEETGPVHATMNWWGSKDGPSLDSGENGVVGPVEYAPWLDHDPMETPTSTECCSSILFLPGLEGSRLYEDMGLPLGLGTTTVKRWEPLSYVDVRSLYLDSQGNSIGQNIYSKDPIDVALYVRGIYYKFTHYMDDLTSAGTINSWRPYAYDWRQPIGQIVNGQEKRATTTESLLETVTALASESKTGKVTIIAHSLGGLVAKALVEALSAQGRADLIDEVISVAVPYLGTPQAILSLLHGSDQSIAAGLILKEYVARGLGVNMASAYTLLPSEQYFDKVSNPVITFSSTTVTDMNNGSYPVHIADAAGMSSFIVDTKNGRVEASTTGTTSADTARAIRGNSLLMAASDAVHNMLDPFIWPANIVKWAIVGWNKQTASGIAYSERVKCLASLIGLTCTPRPTHEKILTPMGDGTVVVPSAMHDDGTVAAIDLQSASDEAHIGIDHSNILESSTTLTLIGEMIKSDTSRSSLSSSSTLAASSSPLAQFLNIPGVTIGAPKELSTPTYLVVSTHSPVELHVYDSKGNHTGKIDLPPELSGSDIYDSYETNIPGSDYSTTDEGDSYVYVPDDGRKYSVSVQGIGVGEFELDVEKKSAGNTISTLAYTLLPTTPLTVASTTVGGDATSSLALDEDGDGTTDMIVQPNKPFDLITYLEMYKQTITKIASTLAKGKLLVKRIDKLEDLVRLGKTKKAQLLTARLDNRMSHMKFKKLTSADKQQILDMFDLFIQQFE